MKPLGKSFISFSGLLSLLCLTSACAWLSPLIPGNRGGTYLILNVKSDTAELDHNVAQTTMVMQKRCELMKLYCQAERLSGEHGNQIRIRISSSADPERTKRILLRQGEELEMRAVVSPSLPSPLQTYLTHEEAAAEAGSDKDVFPYDDINSHVQSSRKSFVIVERTPIITGQDIREAEAAMSAGYGKEERYQINFRLLPAGAARFGQWTAANIDRYIAVVLNKEVRSVAYIKGQIFDSGQISGNYSKQEAEDTAMSLMSGSLPVPVEAVEEGTF